MFALIQRVTEARVVIEERIVGSIGVGIVVFLGVRKQDTSADVHYMVQKMLHMRLFADELGKMNRNVQEISGEILVVSQFTLYGDTRKGNRPSFSEAARPEDAKPLYSQFVDSLRRTGLKVESGVFQAHMKVHLVNDGPVTLVCRSEFT